MAGPVTKPQMLSLALDSHGARSCREPRKNLDLHDSRARVIRVGKSANDFGQSAGPLKICLIVMKNFRRYAKANYNLANPPARMTRGRDSCKPSLPKKTQELPSLRASSHPALRFPGGPAVAARAVARLTGGNKLLCVPRPATLFDVRPSAWKAGEKGV